MKKVGLIALSLGAVGVMVVGYIKLNQQQTAELKAGNPPVAVSKPTDKIVGIETIPAESNQVPAAVKLGKYEKIERLRASGSPVDAFAAYKLIRECVVARRVDTEVQAEPSATRIPSSEICDNITPAQVVSRLALLEKAATNGIHGALYAFSIEGPQGYGISVDNNPASPETLEWVKRIKEYQEAGAKTGDAYSLLTLSDRYENEEPRNLEKALTYWTAYNELNKVGSTKSNAKNRELVVQRLSLKLSSEQSRKAIDEGREIALSLQGGEKK